MHSENEKEIRKKKLQEWEKKHNNPFQITKFSQNTDLPTIIRQFSPFSQRELKEKNVSVSVAGRLFRLDSLGKKLIFADLTSQSEKIQLKVSESKEKQDKVKDFAELLDKGDVVGIKGVVCKTNSGELSIEVNDFILLSKCLNPIPNILIDEEERFRKRYLDLIVNRQNREILQQRFQIINSLRGFLNQQGFLEMETPILVSSASGAQAKPFVTHHNKLHRDFYLRIATEIPLKMLLVGGFEKVYEIGRIFRNEGIDARHNPEFTTIEIYQAYENAEYMMNFTEEIFSFLIHKLLLKKECNFNSHQVSLTKPFVRISMSEAIKKHLNIDFAQIKDIQQAQKLVKNYNLKLEDYQNTIGHIIYAFFSQYVEKELVQPTFIYDFPVEISPLAKSSWSNPQFAERFELYIAGLEFANGYSELNDSQEQTKRFTEQTRQKELGNEEIASFDKEFLEALEYGMPPAVGLGIGIDRLIMLLTEQNSIKEVIAFPQLKEKKE